MEPQTQRSTKMNKAKDKQRMRERRASGVGEVSQGKEAEAGEGRGEEESAAPRKQWTHSITATIAALRQINK